jgi:hypothetical protein
MSSTILKNLEGFMFSSKNMLNYNKIHNTIIKPKQHTVPVIPVPVPVIPVPVIPVPVPVIPVPVPVIPVPVIPVPVIPVPVIPVPAPTADSSFTPFQKDKLFWCFYVLLNGFTEYEMHHTGHYALEKAFKISSVEKLRTMKPEIKELKLKISEVEDELVNKEQISVKGLQVLCLIYKVSITYIYGKQYCEFFYAGTGTGTDTCTGTGAGAGAGAGTGTGTGTGADTGKIGIIRRNEKKEHSLLYEDTILETIKQTHWFIEQVQKPLKAPSAYTLKELQDICEKLEVSLKYKQENALGQITEKNKLKKELYEDILAKL